MKPKLIERLERLYNFIKACIKDKFTGQLVIHFSQGFPAKIRKNEEVDLDKQGTE
jgi:hypothetical protein